MPQVEQWRSVVSWEASYEVSDRGRVRSVDRMRSNHTGEMVFRGRVRRLKNMRGYRTVRLTGPNGRDKTASVHVLVATAFIGSRPVGMEVRHLDGDPSHNDVTNLSWGTQSANNYDRVRHGRLPGRNKEACPSGHVLAMPNLRRSAWERKGERSCLACDRAQKKSRRAAGRGLQIDVYAEADRQYALIMADQLADTAEVAS